MTAGFSKQNCLSVIKTKIINKSVGDFDFAIGEY